MKKELITFDQLAALSFFKFVKLDELDMTLLLEGIKNIADVKIQDDTDEYFVMADGSVILKKSYIDKFNRNVDMKLFESLYGTKVINYIKNLNMFEFVLRKVKLLSMTCCDEKSLNDSMTFLQKNIIRQLYRDGYIVDYNNDDDECKLIKLTKSGEVYLYLIDNKEKIAEFIKVLDINGYDSSLIMSFLMMQDLNKNIDDVLLLTNFASFCDNYIVLSQHETKYTKTRVAN